MAYAGCTNQGGVGNVGAMWVVSAQPMIDNMFVSKQIICLILILNRSISRMLFLNKILFHLHIFHIIFYLFI